MEEQQILKRWRLILGAESQERINALGGAALSQEDILMDSALSQIYGGSSASGSGGKSGGRGPSFTSQR